MSVILLIDDDEDMLAMTGRWLEKAGHAVKKVTSGKDALAYLQGEKPDLILLDYAMPEMDGPAVLKAVRSDESNKNIPILYRTGMDDTSAEDGGDIRPDGVVSKAEGKPGLMRAIEAVLNGLP